MITLRNRRGFTLVELLTVIGIIAVLSAILFPVFANARAKARSSRCLHNLQQIGTAIEVYVQDHHGFLPPWSCTHPGIDPWQPPSGDENVPRAGVVTWDLAIMPYLKQDELLACPDNPNPAEANRDPREARSYAIAQYTQRPFTIPGSSPAQVIAIGGYKDDIPQPSKTVLVFEKGLNKPGAWGDALGQNVYQYRDDDMPGDKKLIEDPAEFPMWHQGGKNFLYLDYHAKWSANTSGPFAHKPREDATIGTCEKWGKPSAGGDWPVD